MNLKSTILAMSGLILFLSNILSAQVLPPHPANPSNTLSLNGKWKFKYVPSPQIKEDSLFFNPAFNISSWQDIKVPGNWEMQGFAIPSYGKKLKEGTGLYRTIFNLPKLWRNTPVYIVFEGVEFGYTLWVNGKQVGTFASAFNRQTFDITSFLNPDKSNTLAVKVITHPRGWEFDTNDDWALSGISRNVSVFSLPKKHIKDVIIKTSVKPGVGIIDVNAVIEQSGKKISSNGLKFIGQLFDVNGKQLKEFVLSATPSQRSDEFLALKGSISIADPKLWSAETPYLYTLKLSLMDRSVEIQQYIDKVGIRELSWDKGIFKLNGQAVKLKGATHHDISPVNGRAITEAEMKNDLDLMLKANMNFIRTSHYPPNTRLLELCDSLGMYVMDEVPYGYGDEILGDTTYLPILKMRAKATVWRDKNRPCVVIWSVGNENPVTPIGLQTGRYVKSLDSTRPYCFPQTPSVFANMVARIPDSLDMLDVHYPQLDSLRQYATRFNKPTFVSEYSHALGLDFGGMETYWEIMANNPKLAGGSVWEFFDQGIVRKAAKKISKQEPTVYAWLNPDSIYDTSTNEGADGMVYANRVPQTDYFEGRKVYTPVKALDEEFYYGPGKQIFKIKLINRYDFTNLSSINGKWQLFADSAVLSTGNIVMDCKPHDSLGIMINLALPDKPVANYYYIKLSFENKSGYQFYEKSYPLKFKDNRSILSKIDFADHVKTAKSDRKITTDNYSFEFSKENTFISLKNENGSVLIAEGPYARIGRKPTVAQDATTASKRSKIKNTMWKQYQLSNPQAQIKLFTNKEITVNYRYTTDSLPQRSVAGDISYLFCNTGSIKIAYHLLPEGNESATETGLSFLIPSALSQFRWVGKGPYAAYPAKERLSEFGIFHLNADDLYFPGNRQNVSCAVFTDETGNGFAMVADDANIAVEKTNAGIVVSHNATVAGRFNKYEWPIDLYSFKNSKGITGSFTIVPFSAESYPKVLQEVFGGAKKVVKAFQPFYHSYDQ